MNDFQSKEQCEGQTCVGIIRQFRQERGETLEVFGRHVGLSAGKVSELERGIMPASPKIALALEKLSAGRIDAAYLNEIVAHSREGMAVIDDQSEAGSWQIAIDHSQNIEASEYNPEHVIICDVCEARVDTQRSCTFVDCPHANRRAA